MCSLDVSDKLERDLIKLVKKSPKIAKSITKKMRQILDNPFHYKPLRGSMHEIRRVHINKSFVLTYKIDEKDKIVKFLDYDHHDKVY